MVAQVNEDVDQRTLLRKYERELRRLRAELQQRQRELVDKRHLLAVRRLSVLPSLRITPCRRQTGIGVVAMPGSLAANGGT